MVPTALLLPEITKGGLPMRWKIKPEQVEPARQLVRSGCCNCSDGNCLLLDDGEAQTCVQLICSSAIYCRHFRENVLPAEKELYETIIKQNETEEL